MAKTAHINYGRQAHHCTPVWFHGVQLDRETELDHEACDHCGAGRDEMTHSFYSYDNYKWEEIGIKAFCNLTCYGGHLASGRTTGARAARLKKALALLEAEEAKQRREARKAARPTAKRKSTGNRHLKPVRTAA